ncbi:hypothetical protein ACXR0O_23415 [Verrucomicrobiota bacterium sgz303538]
MSTKTHIIGLIICAALVAAFQYGGIVWSLADFHPGYIPDLPEHLHRTSRIGSVMSLPFQRPLQWLGASSGDYPPLGSFIQWLVLPFCYGAFLYLVFAFVRRRTFSHDNRDA